MRITNESTVIQTLADYLGKNFPPYTFTLSFQSNTIETVFPIETLETGGNNKISFGSGNSYLTVDFSDADFDGIQDIKKDWYTEATAEEVLKLIDCKINGNNFTAMISKTDEEDFEFYNECAALTA